MPDFYARVPKEYDANLKYRAKLITTASRDKAVQQQLLYMCRSDFLFWCASFVYLYEPRPRFGRDGKRLPKQVPFIPWAHQIPVIQAIRDNLGIRDIGIEKSRGEGMSWIGDLFALHDWLFDDMAKIGLVSNTEKKADDPGNMDSLMAKIDWELTKLPVWMAGVKDQDWSRNLADHSLVNHRNGSQINAFAATADAGRAGRYKWFMTDELAFWDRGKDSDFIHGIHGSTDSRLVISTPNGNDGEYYHFMHTPSNAVRLKLHWSQNPSKNRGLYRLEGGVPVVVDAANPLPPEYTPVSKKVADLYSHLRAKGFKLEGKLRSPWYDNECDRADATPFSIAQELDLDYGGTMYRIFGPEFFDKANPTVRRPLHRGRLTYNPETLEPEFELDDNGPVLLWVPLDSNKKPPRRPYVCGDDVSSGLGGSYTSNSTLEMFDSVTKEQVMEIASNTIPPSDWADLSMSACKWFHDAYLAWEHNGPGAGFTRRVLDKAYPFIYKRAVLWKKGRKKTKEAGWWTDTRSKETMFAELNRQVKAGELQLHSDVLVKECGQYIRGANGTITHVRDDNTEDDSSKGEAHGDRVIACAVALQALKDKPVFAKEDEAEMDDIPPNCMAARQQRYEARLRASQDEWDNRTNFELACPGQFSSNSDTVSLSREGLL